MAHKVNPRVGIERLEILQVSDHTMALITTNCNAMRYMSTKWP